MSGDPNNPPSPLKLALLHALLIAKTYLHPEALGRGSRRHGPRRKSDQLRERIYRFWGIVVTVLILWASFTVKGILDDNAKSRVEGTHQRCELVHTIIDTAIDLGVPRNTPNLNKLRRNLADCRRLERQAAEDAK